MEVRKTQATIVFEHQRFTNNQMREQSYIERIKLHYLQMALNVNFYDKREEMVTVG